MEKTTKAKIRKIENVFRQIAEEKQYFTAKFKEKEFYVEAKGILGSEDISLDYVKFWLSGYRKRNTKK